MFVCANCTTTGFMYLSSKWEVVSDVAKNLAEWRLLTRRFNFSELEYLRKQPSFRKVVALMASLKGFDKVVTLGQRLLNKRDASRNTKPVARL